MVSIKDIVKAINRTLKVNFPTITIQSTDVKEGYQRPCFYVDVVDFENELIMDKYDHKTAAFSLYYFPSDPINNRLELLEIKEALTDAFIGTLEVTQGFKIHILDTTASINDGVLNFDFEIEYYQVRREKDNHGGYGDEYSYIENVEFKEL